MDLSTFLNLYTVNEIKRQGEVIGQTHSRFRAWKLDNFIAIVDEENNSPVAVFESAKNIRLVHIYDQSNACRLMLAGAGVL